MMVAVFTCTDCSTTSRHAEPREAMDVLLTHECAQQQTVEGLFTCGSCGLKVTVLVDDGPLCVRCDALHYPVAA